jgi:type I restriction enzyme M protein
VASFLNKPKLDNLASDIWKSAERLRGKFKAYEYQGVILPIIVIRRLECVLIKWREDKAAEILAKRPNIKEDELAKLVKGMEMGNASFSNKSDWTLRKVYEEDHTLLEENFRAYLNGFSKNVDDIIDHFNYRETLRLMVKNNRLAPILNQYKELELGPDKLSPLEMGYIYEELLRRFSEQSGEEAGEHFTPREVIRLMVELLDIAIPDRHISIYDPACGTGGMLSVAKEHLLDRSATLEEKANIEKYVTVCGQELSPTNYAICQADLLIKDDRQAKRCILATRSFRTICIARNPATNCPNLNSVSTTCSPTHPLASLGAARTVTRTRRRSWRRLAIRPGYRG